MSTILETLNKLSAASAHANSYEARLNALAELGLYVSNPAVMHEIRAALLKAETDPTIATALRLQIKGLIDENVKLKDDLQRERQITTNSPVNEMLLSTRHKLARANQILDHIRIVIEDHQDE